MARVHCAICRKKLRVGEKDVCKNTECVSTWRKQRRLWMQKYRKRKPDLIRAIQKRSEKKTGPRRREQMRLKKGVELVSCEICGRQFEFLAKHLVAVHGIAVDHYRKQYLGKPTISKRIRELRVKGSQSRAKYKSYDGKDPDHILFEFLTGALLGDGSLEQNKNKKNARYAEGGSNEQYLYWKYEFLKQYFPCSFKEILSSPHSKSGKRYLGWWIKTTTHPILTKWRQYWYQDRKNVPHKLVTTHLTEFALAIWFCDDGHMARWNGLLYTMAFDKEDVYWLANLLETRFKIKCRIPQNKKGQYFIKFYGDSARTMKRILKKYNLPGMDYKAELPK